MFNFWLTLTTITNVASLAASGALVTQADTPLIGPADIVGGIMIAAGSVLAIAGAATYGGGLVADAIQ